ncbi:MAG TPA: hypothetical protein VF529_00570 [Solirubrobacteraceae bacterium]|jgi:hypothetical protein
MQTTNRAPASAAGSPAGGMLARVRRALRGDKHTAGADPPAAGDAQGTVAQDLDGDGPGRPDVAESEMPLHFAPPVSRAEER